MKSVPRKRGRPPGSSISGGNRAGLDAARLDPGVIVDGPSKRNRPQVERYTDCGPSTRLKDCEGNDLEAMASDSDEEIEVEREVRDRHPNHKRSGKRRSKQEAAAARAKERAERIEALVRQGDEVFIQFSWEDRKNIALSTFTQAISTGCSKMEAYERAAFAARVSSRTAQSWLAQWHANEGAWSESLWGAHSKWVSVFTDERIKQKSLKWWLGHAPKKGEPNTRIADFQVYLNGTSSATGLLERELGNLSKPCLASCTKFAHALGFSKQSLKKGSFNDAHESDYNVNDRNTRFLPEYFRYYSLSPHTTHVGDAVVEVDSLDDLTLRSNVYPITTPSSEILHIDMGGLVDVDSNETVWLMGSHDESCAAAGEFETSAWISNDSRQVCMDKSKGPSRHASKIVTEFWNGCI